MTNEEILNKAIDKAVSNGYKWYVLRDYLKFVDGEGFFYKSGEYFASIESVIFDHKFAKALWGVSKVVESGDGITFNKWKEMYGDMSVWRTMHKVPNWEYHLQQMVLEEDPIKYLERFI